MIGKHNQLDLFGRRRFLSFPAVHPCEGISPATLVEALIALAHQICHYRSKFFATQRRNSKEIIRHIGILLEFLEEVGDNAWALPESAILCFSELHLTFQKTRFLLEDISREGARLWILMKSPLVSGQFHVLIRAIATALDVLPLDSIELGDDVEELVNLLARQARRTSFRLDQGDESAMAGLHVILDHFEKGITPTRGVIRRVLHYLGISSWSDCQKEIKFLTEEMGYDCSDTDERELPLLSSLVGFLSYCRGVIFESSDYQNHRLDQGEVRLNTEILSCLNHEDLICPISLELMTDPVTVYTGQTYDRSSIQKWLQAGNLICPKTGKKLITTDLVPNTALRKLIHQFCIESGISLPRSCRLNHEITRTIGPESPAAMGALKSLSRFLARTLVFGSNEQKNKAVLEVRLLSKSNIFNRSCLVDAGVVPVLLNLLSSTDPTTQENAISALLKLSKHVGGRIKIMECGGLRSIVSVLKRGPTDESKQAAAAAIFYLSLVKGSQRRIGEMPETIPSLVELIKEGTPCGKKNAALAIFGLLLDPDNHPRVLEAGTVSALVNTVLCSPSAGEKVELVVDSLAVLASLAEHADGSISILKTPALPQLTRLLRSTPSRSGREYIVSILLSLCINGGRDVIPSLSRDPSVMASLYSLLSEETSMASKASRKVRSLIHVLLNFTER
ncbi:hypothetical protein SAY86_011785 [Trapa natans]|uniref:RING-type E3 ubiquitin transferase n=1 Tax=Trapa natans TaxID=22666 RepID=A0AAN7MBQ0_TRANT|nr:hypothetical protein SAY86_011785 [Trapa natans]